MTTINHETGLPYLASSVLSAYSHSAETGPMTADQMLEAWRQLLAEDSSVFFEESPCAIDLICRIEPYRQNDYTRIYEGENPDPLKAFELAYNAYRKAQTHE